MPKIDVNVTTNGGATLTLSVNEDEVTGLDQSLSQQEPAGLIRGERGERTVINFRNVAFIEYTIPVPPEATPTDPAADLAALTKANLVQLATDAGIDHDPKAPKADLVAALTDAGVTPPTAE